MQRVGAGWQATELSVQAEHFASNPCASVITRHAAPPRARPAALARPARIVATCAPGDGTSLLR
jgi:hypothetical protein